MHFPWKSKHFARSFAANSLKPFIAGSYIIIIRHEIEGRPTSSLANNFQICEIKVSLASFGRKLNAKYLNQSDPDQHKFWSHETHLLYPDTNDVCYEVQPVTDGHCFLLILRVGNSHSRQCETYVMSFSK